MLKSIGVWAFDPQQELVDTFAQARAAGFNGIELAIAEDGPITPASTREECEKIAGQVQDAGLKVAGLASGMGWSCPVAANDSETRKRAVENTAASLHVAKWLGTDAILLVPGTVGDDAEKHHVSYREAMDNTRDSLEKLKSVAEETGTKIGIENVWNKFLLSPLETRDFIDSFGSDQIGAYFDVGNVILTGYPEEWIEILEHRIVRVHLKDFKREVGTLDGFCDLLEGDVNYPAVMKALRKVNYDGPVIAEFFGVDDAAIRKISRAIDDILKM